VEHRLAPVVQPHAGHLGNTVCLPEGLVAALEPDTLRLVEGSHVDDALRGTESDLIYEVRLRNRPVLLYVLVEHQSTIDPWMPLRLLRYILRLWERWRSEHTDAKRLPPVLPVVLYHGAVQWSAPTSLEDLVDLPEAGSEELRRHQPALTIELQDLTGWDDEAITALNTTATVRAALLFLRNIKSPRLRDLLERATELLQAVRDEDPSLRPARLLLEYVLRAGEEVDLADLRDVSRALGPAVEDEFMTLAQRLEQKGMREGMREGIREGMREGMRKGLLDGRRDLLRRLLRVRFGSLPDRMEAQLAGGTAEELDRWAERVFEAATVEEVFAAEG